MSTNSPGFITWNDGVYCASYNEKAILLNVSKNEFIFFDQDQTNFIQSILGRHFTRLDSNARKLIAELVEAQIVKLQPEFSSAGFSDIKQTTGSYNCSWEVGDDSWKLRSINLHILIKSIRYLRRAKSFSSQGSLESMLYDLRKSADQPVACSYSKSHERLIKIGHNVNFAIKFLSVKIKCLEFAYCLARIAFEEGISCTFNIGAQTYPFISHAWVEGIEGVVLDDDRLGIDLSVLVKVGNGNEG